MGEYVSTRMPWTLRGRNAVRALEVLTEERHALAKRLDAAVAEARALGVGDALICQAAGLSRSTLHYRYGSKKAGVPGREVRGHAARAEADQASA